MSQSTLDAQVVPVENTTDSNVGPVVEEKKEKSHEEVAQEASASYQGLLPYVKKLGNSLGGQKSVTRVLHAFMAYPLDSTTPKLLGPSEKQLFQLLQDIAASKAFLMNFYAAEMMELKQQEIAARKAAEGEENGPTTEA